MPPSSPVSVPLSYLEGLRSSVDRGGLPRARSGLGFHQDQQLHPVGKTSDDRFKAVPMLNQALLNLEEGWRRETGRPLRVVRTFRGPHEAQVHRELFGAWLASGAPSPTDQREQRAFWRPPVKLAVPGARPGSDYFDAGCAVELDLAGMFWPTSIGVNPDADKFDANTALLHHYARAYGLVPRSKRPLFGEPGAGIFDLEVMDTWLAFGRDRNGLGPAPDGSIFNAEVACALVGTLKVADANLSLALALLALGEVPVPTVREVTPMVQKVLEEHNIKAPRSVKGSELLQRVREAGLGLPRVAKLAGLNDDLLRHLPRPADR